jgi:hypothetical protein
MKRVVVILIITIIHLGIAMGSYLVTFEVYGFMFGMAPKPSEGAFHSVLTTIHTVTMFPLGLVAVSLGSGARFLAWPLMVINSLLWAVVIYLLFTRLRRGGS